MTESDRKPSPEAMEAARAEIPQWALEEARDPLLPQRSGGGQCLTS